MRALLVIATLLLVSSCSSSGGGNSEGESDGGMVSLDQTPSWTLDGNAYSSGTSASSADPDGGVANIVVGTTGLSLNNGAYSGSSLTIAHTLQGPGTYAIVATVADLVNTQTESPTARLAQIAMTVGTLQVNPLGATTYQGTVGELEVVVDDAGFYHFSTSETITLEISGILGNGVPDAPSNATATLVNVYNHDGNQI